MSFKRPLEENEFNEFLAEYAGKLQLCTNPTCPNKTADERRPYPGLLGTCATWKSGTDHLSSMVKVRKGMTPADCNAMDAFVEYEEGEMPSWGHTEVRGGQLMGHASPAPSTHTPMQHTNAATGHQQGTELVQGGGAPPQLAAEGMAEPTMMAAASQHHPFCQEHHNHQQ